MIFNEDQDLDYQKNRKSQLFAGEDFTVSPITISPIFRPDLQIILNF